RRRPRRGSAQAPLPGRRHDARADAADSQTQPLDPMIPRRLLALALALAFVSGTAQAAAVIVGKSEIAFTMKQMGVNFDGRFRQWKADIVFAPNALDKSKAEVDVDLGSLDLASTESEAEAKGPLWFNTPKFPVAHFASTSIKNVG